MCIHTEWGHVDRGSSLGWLSSGPRNSEAWSLIPSVDLKEHSMSHLGPWSWHTVLPLRKLVSPTRGFSGVRRHSSPVFRLFASLIH